jgi:adenylate cyclase
MNERERTAVIRMERGRQSTQELLREMSQDVQDLIELLKRQQGTMRSMGISLPTGALDRLLMTQMRLDALSLQHTSVQTELRQLRALAQTTDLITSTLDTDDVINQVMDTVVMLTGAERGFVMVKQASGAMEVAVARGIDRAQLQSDDFQVSSTIINQVIGSGEGVLTDDAGDDPRYQGQHSIMRGSFRSILAVPLMIGREVTGVVYCDNRILAGLFKDSELNILRAFADQAAVALQNARLYEDLQAQLGEIARIRDLMANVFASIASGVVTLNLRDAITTYNPAAAHITGVPQSEVIGARLWDVLPSASEQFVEKLRRVQEQGTQEEVETTITLDGRGQRTWQISLTPLRDEGGAMQGVAMVLDDLTETRQNEARLKEVRRYLPVALVDKVREVDLHALRGEERTITVISADVRGFSSFSEKLPPETLMQVVNRYLSAASDAVNLYEGVVMQYIGDAVIGLYNTPLNPQDDHAGRAVRAAIRLVNEVRVLHQRLPEEFRLFYGVGIHTGLAVLGNVGSSERREYMAMGEAVDMGKLMQENAGKGEILISPTTYALVESEFECTRITPQKTKGNASLDSVYRIVGRKRRTAQAGVVEG